MKRLVWGISLLGLLPGCGSEGQSCIDARARASECGITVGYVSEDDCQGVAQCKQECVVDASCEELTAAQAFGGVLNDYTRCVASCR
jgi:hypothetical protein